MVNQTGWSSKMYEALWGKQEKVKEEIINQVKSLQVKIDPNPIGGYRGKVGTLTIDHVDHKVFTDWDEEDLEALAQISKDILKINEHAGIDNTLIFGRYDNTNGQQEFKLSFVPYPKCNWIEKMQGFIHVIFGSPYLNKQQVQEIAQFYKSLGNIQVKNDAKIASDGNQDAFCRRDVIEKQKITDLTIGKYNYHLLYDYRPKGKTSQDPHLLVIPEGESGHNDGARVKSKMRLHLFKITQHAMKIFQHEGYSTILFLERNGSKLQGVSHKSVNVIGIDSFPNTLFEKIWAIIRQLFAPALSAQALKSHIEHYQKQDWQKAI